MRHHSLQVVLLDLLRATGDVHVTPTCRCRSLFFLPFRHMLHVVCLSPLEDPAWPVLLAKIVTCVVAGRFDSCLCVHGDLGQQWSPRNQIQPGLSSSCPSPLEIPGCNAQHTRHSWFVRLVGRGTSCSLAIRPPSARGSFSRSAASRSLLQCLSSSRVCRGCLECSTFGARQYTTRKQRRNLEETTSLSCWEMKPSHVTRL